MRYQSSPNMAALLFSIQTWETAQPSAPRLKRSGAFTAEVPALFAIVKLLRKITSQSSPTKSFNRITTSHTNVLKQANKRVAID